MKIAAAAAFGLTALVYNPLHHKVSATDLAKCQMAVIYLYERTQAELSSRGIYRLDLYRGIRSQQYVVGGITSWTSDFTVARDFNGYDVIQEDILAQRILAFHAGPLWDNSWNYNESEYIVLSTVHP